jgi:hypothetical protein
LLRCRTVCVLSNVALFCSLVACAKANVAVPPPACSYIKASNTAANNYFGLGMSLSADGRWLAVGAFAEGSRATGINGDQTNDATVTRGAVYVYAWSGTAWTQQAYIKPAVADDQDQFGWSVSLSADGTWLAVGATAEDSSATGIDGDPSDDDAWDSGAAYVFTRSGETWTQQAYIKASNVGAQDFFGTVVSLSADGTRLAVVAAGEDSNATGVNGDHADDSAAESGAVYVFARSATTWEQEAYVKASNTQAGDDFGDWALSLAADGTRLAVGAHGEGSSAMGIDGDQTDDSAGQSGAVYVFGRSATTWAQEAYVKASNTEAGDYFGSSVSLSADGSRLAIGALLEDSSATGVDGDQLDRRAPYSGAVYVFTREAMGWAQEAYLKASNTDSDDHFGSVSLSADGARLAVGATGERSNATGLDGEQEADFAWFSGAVYMFTWSSTTWTQAAYVKASNTDGGDGFGGAVSLSADGARLAVSAQDEASAATGVDGDQDDNSAGHSGAVYVY